MSLQLTYGSQPINGQLVPEYTSTAMFPSPAYVPYYAGKGAATPTLPPPVQFNGNASDPWSTGLDIRGGGPAAAAADPFNPAKSPVVWAIAFLVIGVIGLRHVHWRG